MDLVSLAADTAGLGRAACMPKAVWRELAVVEPTLTSLYAKKRPGPKRLPFEASFRAQDRAKLSGQWSVVSGQWSVVSGQWPVVSCQNARWHLDF
jgi:hypothetical protein